MISPSIMKERQIHDLQNSMISSRLIDFMNRLIKDTGRKVISLDNLKVHHSKDVAKRAWKDQRTNNGLVSSLVLSAKRALQSDVESTCGCTFTGIQAETVERLKHKPNAYRGGLLKRATMWRNTLTAGRWYMPDMTDVMFIQYKVKRIFGVTGPVNRFPWLHMNALTGWYYFCQG